MWESYDYTRELQKKYQKKHPNAQPVTITGSKIASSFWGKARRGYRADRCHCRDGDTAHSGGSRLGHGRGQATRHQWWRLVRA